MLFNEITKMKLMTVKFLKEGKYINPRKFYQSMKENEGN